MYGLSGTGTGHPRPTLFCATGACARSDAIAQTPNTRTAIVTLIVRTQQIPHVPVEERATVHYLGNGVSNVHLCYGFMEDPDVPEGLRQAQQQGLWIDEDLTFFLGRETLLPTRRPGMAQGMPSSARHGWTATSNAPVSNS